MPGYGELEFDLPSALLAALIEKFARIDTAPLTVENAQTVPNEQGVYFLYHRPAPDEDPRLVYIGKTDSDAGLRSRLVRHARKLIGRLHLRPGDVFFKAVRLYVFTAMDLEASLIRHHGGVAAVPWNNSGFGSNDPGKERDTTFYKPEHFDTRFPIDLDSIYVPLEPGEYPVSEVIGQLKARLPFLVRYERPGRARASFHEDFGNSRVQITTSMNTRTALAACMAALPEGWHATALPSHIIIYKNDNRRFPSGVLIGKS